MSTSTAKIIQHVFTTAKGFAIALRNKKKLKVFKRVKILLYEPKVPNTHSICKNYDCLPKVSHLTHTWGMEKRFTVMKRRDFFVRKIYYFSWLCEEKLKIKKEKIIYCLNIFFLLFFFTKGYQKCLSEQKKNFLNGFVYGFLFCCNITTLVTQLFSSSLFVKFIGKVVCVFFF